MIKIKIIAAIFLLGFVGLVLNSSYQISVSANDISDEIAKYKTWSRVTKEPVRVDLGEAAFSG